MPMLRLNISNFLFARASPHTLPSRFIYANLREFPSGEDFDKDSAQWEEKTHQAISLSSGKDVKNALSFSSRGINLNNRKRARR